MPQNKLPSHLIKQRRLYQRGLLAWLRGDEKGAVVMRDAIAGIEDVTQQQSLRSFWWTVGALLESVTEHGVEGGFNKGSVEGVKQEAPGEHAVTALPGAEGAQVALLFLAAGDGIGIELVAQAAGAAAKLVSIQCLSVFE